MIMDFIKYQILILIAVFLIGDCKSSSSSNDYLAALVGDSTASPVVTSFDPVKVNPSISYSNVTYPSSIVTIKGRNFSYVTSENIVTFNNLPATVQASTNTELIVKVPDGIPQGIMKVMKPGGTCSSLDQKSGYNCSGKNYYVDCYAGIGSPYGEEVTLEVGKVNKVTYSKTTGKAFKVELLPGTRSFTFICPNYMNYVYFSNTCSPTAAENAVNPQWSLQGGYTMQFVIVTGSGECSISIY